MAENKKTPEKVKDLGTKAATKQEADQVKGGSEPINTKRSPRPAEPIND